MKWNTTWTASGARVCDDGGTDCALGTSQRAPLTRSPGLIK